MNCKQCGNEFNNKISSQKYCKKECMTEYYKIYKKIYNAKYNQRVGAKEYFKEKNKENNKKESHKQYMSNYMVKYRKLNPEKFVNRDYSNRIYLNQCNKSRKKRLENPLIRCQFNLSKRVRKFMKTNNMKKSKPISEIVGLNNLAFKKYIEDQFKPNMTWTNYGDWHLDHIIPISSAKSEKQVYQLNHYSNLQPLWAKENLSKGNKV